MEIKKTKINPNQKKKYTQSPFRLVVVVVAVSNAPSNKHKMFTLILGEEH